MFFYLVAILSQECDKAVVTGVPILNMEGFMRLAVVSSDSYE